MKRKRILATAIMIISICSMLAGCKKEKEPDNQLIWCVAGVLGYQSEADVGIYQERINTMLQEQGMDYNVKMQVIAPNYGGFTEEQKQQIAESDIITMQSQINEQGQYFLPTIKESIEQGVFAPLDEYMASEQGKKIMENQLFAMALEQGKLGQTQWLLPTDIPVIIGSSLMIDQVLWEKAGMTNQDKVPAFEACDELFAKLYEANGKKPILKFSAAKTESETSGMPIILPEFLLEIQNNSLENIDGIIAGIVKVREMGNDNGAEKLLETAAFERIMNAWNRYMEKGYVTLEPSFDELVTMQNSFIIEMEYFNDGERNYVIPMSESYIQYTAMITANPTKPLIGISKSSDKKDIAFEVLSYVIGNRICDDINCDGYSLCFRSRLDEKQEKDTIAILKDSAKFIESRAISYTNTPEIEAINTVFENYCKEDITSVKEIYFGKDEDLWMKQLTEQLEKAGIDRIVEKINSQP